MMSCSSGKICYPDKAEAKRATQYARRRAKRQNAGKWHCYQCDECGSYHTTRMSKVRFRQMQRSWTKNLERQRLLKAT